MVRQDKRRHAEAEDAFKGQLLATNYDLYDKLYGESSFDQIEKAMNETDFYHPSSEADLKKLISEFNRSQPKDASSD